MTAPHDKDFESIEQHEHEHHIVSPRVYLTIVVILLVMTATTVGVSYIDMGLFNPVVALAIAAFKMILVVLFFMHVKYSTKLTKLTVISGLFTFLVLVGMTLSDYFTRAWGRW
jgi:cytochrome c oxidase subunit IV